MIQVAIVDDHPVARHGMMWILAAEPDIEVVSAVGDYADLPSIAPAVVTCDPFPLGEPPRLDAMRRVAARVPVLVVSSSDRMADVAAAAQAGARGYLCKSDSERAFAPALRALASGARYFPAPPAAARVEPRHRPGAAAKHAQLSPREQEALAYIGRGFTHQQTARRMGVSKATVDTYVGRVRDKLGLGNKAELALAALCYVEPRHQPSRAAA
jgi:two-component system, NarL family, nitrate/nitrite response regulator NarL